MKMVVQNGDPVLREVAAEVTEEQFGTKELRQVIADLTQALEEQKDGVAIAAPQIGVSLRIFLVRYDRLHAPPEGMAIAPELGVYINPEFTRASRRREEMDEGCLSVRGTYGKVFRHERATVRAQDENGAWFERGGGGILAQVFQHETDHLNGILFIDHAVELYKVNKDEAVQQGTTLKTAESNSHE